MRIIYISLIAALFLFACNGPIQLKKQESVVAFYNLENLFDTINTPNVYDGEFTPKGRKEWDSKRYKNKLSNISKVIANLGVDDGFYGPSVVGLCEMENKQVLVDLLAEPALANLNLQIIHFDSPDKRGVDVALIYKAVDFKIHKTSVHPLIIHDEESGKRIFTRDQLLVEGELKGDSVYFIVNHWPSRYGGKERSKSARMTAAKLNRAIIDSIMLIKPSAKIISMGDLNDDPHDVSIKQGLRACSMECCNKNQDCTLFNPMETMHQQDSIGTLYYRGRWNLFDQMIISKGLLSGGGLKFKEAKIYKKPYLIQQEGKYKGYLLRTFGGRTYLDGYSDHLPVYLILQK